MTAKQRAAREKFKKVVAEASKLRKKNPKLTQAQAVKQAWAIQYSKEGKSKKVAAIKIIEKGESKSAKAKATYQQVRSKKGTFKGLKKIGETAYYGTGKRVFSTSLRVGEKYEWIEGAQYLEVKYIGLSKKYPNIRAGVKFGDGEFLFQFIDDEGYVQLSKNAVFQSLRTIPKKLGAASSKVKAKKGKSTEMHTDTNSHNVNIRVVSGIDKSDILNNLKKIEQNIISLEIAIQRNKETMKKYPYKTAFWKSYFNKKNNEIRKYIQSLKKQKVELKKHI